MYHLVQDIVDNPGATAMIIGNLVIIESLLSVDNAAVLATMVMDLPESQRGRALKYGIIGAYVFRGLCLLFASILVQVWWLKPLGGAYLLYIAWSWWRGRGTPETQEDDPIDKKTNWFYRLTVGSIGTFWATVALVELMDLAFSIDNVFAAVAFTDNIIIVCIGVFIGILAMRFVAQAFVDLMARYAFLEACAFAVIALLGVKLSLSVMEHLHPDWAASRFLMSHAADWATSALTVGIFVVPIITNRLFNYPKGG
jgi:YkoY family integral membrane protein